MIMQNATQTKAEAIAAGLLPPKDPGGKGPRLPKELAQAVCAAAMLGASVTVLMDPGVLSPPARAQAKRVQRWFTEAVADALPNGIPPAMARKVYTHNEAIIRAGKKHMPEAIFSAPYVVARIQAAWYFVEYQFRKGHLGKSRAWRFLEQTTYTLLCMLIEDLDEYEERMTAVAEDMFVEFLA